MTCRQLGGACEERFQADSFDDIADQAKIHGTEMFMKSDEPHLKAMEDMKHLMENSDAMQEWKKEKKSLFESLPDD